MGQLRDGEALFQPGDPGDSLYILVSGRLQVILEREGGEQNLVAELSRGEMVGLTEALTGERRSTRVVAIRDSELLRLSQQDLLRLGERVPQVMLRLNRILAGRLRQQLHRPGRTKNTLITFAIAPAGRHPDRSYEALAIFARRLTAALEALGPALHLTGERLEHELGPGTARSLPEGRDGNRVTAWLSEQETRFRYIVYEADHEPSAWTRRCLRQADRVLWIAWAGTDPGLSAVERDQNRMPVTARGELVLLHPSETQRPSGTGAWLQPRQVRTHHHVRLDNPQDLDRLVRRLTGRALGLVLSGGGARGFAHIGVLRALREAGLQVDLVGGTSMGAVLGAAFAMDLDDQYLTSLSQDLASPFKLFDLTLPLVSFFAGDKVNRALQQLFGEIQVEDLWRPYFCLSSSLTRAQPVVHQDGPLWQAVRASSAIPGVFSPVLSPEGDLLVDGAVLNNLPVDVMQAFSGGGPLIAVNVFPDIDFKNTYHLGMSVSGWEVLLDRLNPLNRGVQAPSIFENLVRVVELNGVNQAKEKMDLVDLYIRPDVEKYGILEFQSRAEIIACGYHAAGAALRAWRRSPGDSRLAEFFPPTPAARLQRTLDDLENFLARAESG